MRYKKISEGIFRVFAGEENTSMLSRYGIIRDGAAEEFKSASEGAYSFSADGETVTVKGGKRPLHIEVKTEGEGFSVIIGLSEKERFFGLGDSSRDTIMRRGIKARMLIRNVIGYGPMPYLMSTDGWAILVNCTYEHTFDIGAEKADTLRISAKKGTVDFYIFCADSMKKLLELYTSVAGRPVLLPKFAYGYTYVENEQGDARSLLWDIRMMRDKDIACDTMGLEPNWMSKHYDDSVEKSWNKKDYYLPHWLPDNQSTHQSFFFPMREMGMNLSLWLCENYDLLWEEEGEVLRNERSDYTGAEIVDEHFGFGTLIDQITKHGEPWFEHLKKFVDNGAAAFKLDGCTQVALHPDRLWGGRFLDDEVHNVYPVILAKQMKEGFENYTGRRAFINTAGAYTGTQRYAASWAGDTGGGQKTLVSVLNYAMCGHSNTTCDLEVTDPKSLHYGFLISWAQQNGWANWLYPWFIRTEEMVRFYSHLRSALFPYIYAAAHRASETGLPIVRPLPLVYEDTDRFDKADNMYMLGDSLLVGAFDMHLDLPDGKWTDLWTGKVYEGTIDYECPQNRGGALLVKDGAVFVTMTPQKYILEKEHDYILNLFPGKASSFTLYEDDGYTYDYEEGKMCTTFISMDEETDKGFVCTVKKREGAYEGRPDNGHDHLDNSIPEIPGMEPVRDMQVIIRRPGSVKAYINGTPVETEEADFGTRFILPASVREKDAVIKIEY